MFYSFGLPIIESFYDWFSSLVPHIGWLLKLFKKAVTMERYIFLFYAHNYAHELKSLTGPFSLCCTFPLLNIICCFFFQVDVWALGVSAIEMAEVCFISSIWSSYNEVFIVLFLLVATVNPNKCCLTHNYNWY